MGVGEETSILADIKEALEEKFPKIDILLGEVGDDDDSPMLILGYKGKNYAIAVGEMSKSE